MGIFIYRYIYDDDSCEAIRGFHDEAGTNFVSMHKDCVIITGYFRALAEAYREIHRKG